MRESAPPGPRRSATQEIGLSRTQWIWLILDLLWIHALLPNIMLRVVALFRDPATGALARIGSAVALIAGIPFLLVVGFGVAVWGVLAGLPSRPGR